MSENVFNIVQFGSQGGSFTSPGAAAPATFLFPVDAPVPFVLNRAATFPKQDRGRNVRNSAGTGFYGLRAADATLTAEVRFEDLMYLLEMCFAGGVTPTGAGPYVWVYPFEGGAPTLIPYTIEGGNADAGQSQMRLVSCLVDQLTIGFPALTVPGAYPWTISANIYAFDRAINNLTAALAAKPGLEVVQGHLTRLYEGTTATAFAALAELPGSLKSFTATFNRNLERRAYGSASDVATGYGFKDMSAGTCDAVVAISAASKSDFHDIWNVASPAGLGERRWRLKAIGTGSKAFTLDARVGITAVPIDEITGERLFKVTGEFVDDTSLGSPAAPAQISISNSIATL